MTAMLFESFLLQANPLSLTQLFFFSQEILSMPIVFKSQQYDTLQIYDI